jgi:hypothetical protein
MPPATTISASPRAMLFTPRITACEARAAHLADGRGGDLVGDAGVDGGLARGRLADAGLEDVAHEDLVRRGRGDAGLLEGGLDGGGAEARRDDRGERSRKAPMGVRCAPTT